MFVHDFEGSNCRYSVDHMRPMNPHTWNCGGKALVGFHSRVDKRRDAVVIWQLSLERR
jgi:hypothetical protein